MSDQKPRRPDPDIGRLLAETDRHLNEPDGTGRREAFGRLRHAATAAHAPQRTEENTSFKQDFDDAHRQKTQAQPTRKLCADTSDMASNPQTLDNYIRAVAPNNTNEQVLAVATYLSTGPNGSSFTRRSLVDHIKNLLDPKHETEDVLCAFSELIRMGHIVKAPHEGFIVPEGKRFKTGE